MKKIGFLSFGHWSASRQSATRSARDVLQQSIELAVAAEELGADGAYFRVHHFAQQLSSPFPLLAAVGARTSRIEIGTGVIDMRYENPYYMIEDAGAADLISNGRLQLGISRGSPEQVVEGWRHFGYAPPEGGTDADLGRQSRRGVSRAAERRRFRQAQSAADVSEPAGAASARTAFDGTARSHLVGLSVQRDCGLGRAERDEPAKFDAQARRVGRAVSRSAGSPDPRLPASVDRCRTYTEPRVSVSRSIFAMMNDRDRMYFGHDESRDQIGVLDNMRAVFGRSYAAEPDVLIEELRGDEAIAEADTLLLTVPNTLGVEYNAHVIESILTHVAPALGWR